MCNCSKDCHFCKSEAILDGEFVTCRGSKFTASMTATGQGKTKGQAQDSAHYNVEKTLHNFIKEYKPPIVDKKYKIHYKSSCEGEHINKCRCEKIPVIKPIDTFTVSYTVYLKVFPSAVYVPSDINVPPNLNNMPNGQNVQQLVYIFSDKKCNNKIGVGSQNFYINIQNSTIITKVQSFGSILDKPTACNIKNNQTNQQFTFPILLTTVKAVGTSDISLPDYTYTEARSTVKTTKSIILPKKNPDFPLLTIDKLTGASTNTFVRQNPDGTRIYKIHSVFN
jgi:hypothetical protein